MYIKIYFRLDLSKRPAGILSKDNFDYDQDEIIIPVKSSTTEAPIKDKSNEYIDHDNLSKESLEDEHEDLDDNMEDLDEDKLDNNLKNKTFEPLITFDMFENNETTTETEETKKSTTSEFDATSTTTTTTMVPITTPSESMEEVTIKEKIHENDLIEDKGKLPSELK